MRDQDAVDALGEMIGCLQVEYSSTARSVVCRNTSGETECKITGEPLDAAWRRIDGSMYMNQIQQVVVFP
jgi:hypothetical protein